MFANEDISNSSNAVTTTIGGTVMPDIPFWSSANSVWSSANLTMTMQITTTPMSADLMNTSANHSLKDGYVLSEDDQQRVIIIAMLMACEFSCCCTVLFICTINIRGKKGGGVGLPGGGGREW